MNRTIRKLIQTLAVVFVLTTGCTSFSEETPVPDTAPPADFTPMISATGKVVPDTWASLSFQAGGVLEEVQITEGDVVRQGDELLRLGGAAEIQAALAAAQYEQTAARIALDDLIENHDLALAMARQDLKSAEEDLEHYLTPELREAMALQAIADAEKAVDQASRDFRRLTSTASQADIDDAKAAVVLTRDALDKAKDAFDPYANKPEDNLTRATLLAKLSAAQHAYDDAVRRLNSMQGTGSAIDIAVAEARLATAEAQLLESRRDWEDIQNGPDPVEVALREARVAQAQRAVTDMQDGPDPDAFALAEARLANADAQVNVAQSALERLVLYAPFDGTVSELYVKESEYISPGQPVLALADLAHLVVETTDLNEIDVARVRIDGLASITFDALPETVLTARVVYIAPKSTEGAGVNYTVKLILDETPAGLRWGMTAFIDIATE